MKQFFVKSLLIIFAIQFSNCSKSDSDTSLVQTTPTQSVPNISNVYICGYESLGSSLIAKYWKNGEGKNLTDGTKDAIAYSIVVSGNDVYAAGVKTNGLQKYATYWKNGEPIYLTNGVNMAYAESIAVVGNDVYVAGYEKTGVKYVAKYWKNGVVTNLSNGKNDAYAKSIAVLGNNIYVVGWENTGSGDIPKYWKNGVETSLPSSTNLTWLYSVVVSGNDVYITGNNSKYWKNEIAINTPASYIAIGQNGDIHTVNTEVDMAVSKRVIKYYKNGVENFKTDVSKDAVANSISVSGNDVYIVGYEVISGKKIAKYWKNGLDTSLASSSAVDSQAKNVFIQP